MKIDTGLFFSDVSFTKVDIFSHFYKILFLKVDTCRYLSYTQQIQSSYPDCHQAIGASHGQKCRDYPHTASALGGGLGRPRRSGIPLQKERGMALQRESLLIFLFPSLLIKLKSLRVVHCPVTHQCHDYPQQLVLDIIQCDRLMLALLY